MERWTASQSQTYLAPLESAIESFRAADPNSSVNADLCGRWYLKVFRDTQNEVWLNEAIEHFESANALHPNMAQRSAQLAWCYHLSGNKEKSQAMAQGVLYLKMLKVDQEARTREFEFFQFFSTQLTFSVCLCHPFVDLVSLFSS